MRLKLVTIADRGSFNDERVHLKVLSRASLTHYAVFATLKATNGSVITPPKHAYWFTDLVLNPGDNVVLYTRIGTNNSQKREDGLSNHFFFWGLPSPIFSQPSSCAILLEIDTWESTV
jgi:hypothetical protein